ncbi:MAG TPA: hypothetical protein VIM61_14630 [Chthoniobacterales bacterium]|jgi:hypothetical protein
MNDFVVEAFSSKSNEFGHMPFFINNFETVHSLEFVSATGEPVRCGRSKLAELFESSTFISNFLWKVRRSEAQFVVAF